MFPRREKADTEKGCSGAVESSTGMSAAMNSDKNRAPVRRMMLLLLVVLILCACRYFSAFYYQFMLIQGNSMSPTYRHFQLVVLDKQNREYHPGDVIAFRCDGLKTVLVKRIAAGPGQSAVIQHGSLYVDGAMMPFYEKKTFDYSGLLENEQKLSKDEFIVIGDNISESKDSRYEQVGIVKAESIIGKVAAIETTGEIEAEHVVYASV